MARECGNHFGWDHLYGEVGAGTEVVCPTATRDRRSRGYLPERTIQTGIGGVLVRQPRVQDDRVDKAGESARFTSKILPPYLRKTRTLDTMIPWIYLKGISTNGFSEALQALLGPEAPGLSSTSIVRLKHAWEEDYEGGSQRSFKDKRYVYFWADRHWRSWRRRSARSSGYPALLRRLPTGRAPSSGAEDLRLTEY